MTAVRARIGLVAMAICLLSTVASAQDGLRSASLPERTPMNPIPPSRDDLFRAAPDTYTARPPGRRDARRYRGDGYAYGASVFGLTRTRGYARDSDRRMRGEANGYLQLQVVPASAEVFVDGLYVGNVNDVRQIVPGHSLEPGPHRLELRAPGYESVTVDVKIDPNDTRVYRASLEAATRREPPASTVIAAAPPRTFYVIPGCYAGDKPPQADRLRPGCDVSKTRTRPPLISIAR